MNYYFNPKLKKLLSKTFCGLELESLRVTEKSSVSQTPHPKEFGSPLYHPYFTNDFSKAQLEHTTSKYSSNKAALNALKNSVAFAHQNLDNELFWPLAMPAKLNPFSKEIIANFGFTDEAEMKQLYREGLVSRYGPDIQMISGIHYNFSLSKEFFVADYEMSHSQLPLKDFISNRYLHLMRNFIDKTYLLVYLFGASPTCHKSYQAIKGEFKDATSIRMSQYGYHSKHQCQLGISYNNFEDFCKSYEKELSTHCSDFEHIETQINSNILQNESELYVPIRAKGNIHCKNATLESIKHCGIHYVEVRTIDLNPFEPTSVSLEDLDFLRLFLIYCLVTPSKKLSKQEILSARYNQHHIALHGRKPGVKLHSKKSFKNEALRILQEVMVVAIEFKLEHLVEVQIEKIKDVEKTLSSKIAKKQFLKFGEERAHFNMQYFKNYPLSIPYLNKLKRLATTSLEKQTIEDAKSRFNLKGYETLEKSTQCLIREALKRKINVEVIDEKENFLILEKNGRKEYIKQATKTSYDSYISPLMMENKQLSKKLLKEHQINTPDGLYFSSEKEALNSYPSFEKHKIVIKPNTTNFGIGIHFIEPYSIDNYQKCIKDAFRHSNGILVETFFSGEEYRFLVINKAVIGIVKRIPANVIGNGKDNIETLVRKKNKDPRNYKDKKTAIRLLEKEKSHLAQQKLTKNSIPKLGEQIFLRSNSNVSTGGDSIDMTEEVNLLFHPIAIKAASSAGANICGVDIMIKEVSKPPEPDNYTVIEINYNPMLALHEFPVIGKPRNSVKPLLDFLGF
ncbi:MAG: bifunctional glutamate--cysteine ligase GshA/glutathione synthetase GshB [Rhabdochlamydiaceae bacterium]|nr:bifunctional glutamate--cysteine ligase GshA/glutathione synthetase GshB [Candidatus Amphrikana amoebophyrae]